MIEKAIKASVIIPIYNAEKYLESALAGVLDQTLKEIEIICVDDGSTDESSRILKSIAARDNRVRVIMQEHKNAGSARNRGLREAKGEYLSFLDSDDIFEPEMLERAYNAAEEKRADIVAFRSDRYNESTGYYEEARWTIREEFLPGGDIYSIWDDGDIFSCFAGWAWDKLIRRELVVTKRLSFQEQRTINDMYFVHSALASAKGIIVIDDILIHKRTGMNNSITANYSGIDASCDMFRALKGIKEYLEQLYDSVDIQNKRINAAIYYTLWNLDKNLDSNEYDGVYSLTKNFFLPELGIKIGEYESCCLLELQRRLIKLYSSDSREYRWQRRLERRDSTYLFPFELVEKGSKIVLYGAGRVGQTYYRQIRFSKWCEIVKWIDENPYEKGGTVKDISEIQKCDYDAVIIAIKDNAVAKLITSKLTGQYVEKQKIVWRSPEIEVND